MAESAPSSRDSRRGSASRRHRLCRLLGTDHLTRARSASDSTKHRVVSRSAACPATPPEVSVKPPPPPECPVFRATLLRHRIMRGLFGADALCPPSPVGHAAPGAKNNPEKYLSVRHNAVYSMPLAWFYRTPAATRPQPQTNPLSRTLTQPVTHHTDDRRHSSGRAHRPLARSHRPVPPHRYPGAQPPAAVQQVWAPDALHQ